MKKSDSLYPMRSKWSSLSYARAAATAYEIALTGGVEKVSVKSIHEALGKQPHEKGVSAHIGNIDAEIRHLIADVDKSIAAPQREEIQDPGMRQIFEILHAQREEMFQQVRNLRIEAAMHKALCQHQRSILAEAMLDAKRAELELQQFYVLSKMISREAQISD